MGQDALGSGRKELVQVLLRKSMVSEGEGGWSTSELNSPTAGTRCDPGATLLWIFWLCLGLGPCGTLRG